MSLRKYTEIKITFNNRFKTSLIKVGIEVLNKAKAYTLMMELKPNRNEKIKIKLKYSTNRFEFT